MNQLAVYEQYAAIVRRDYPQGVGRSEMAAKMGVDKTTAAYHLKKCVSRGKLVSVYTWVRRNSRGWVYYAPETLKNIRQYQEQTTEDIEAQHDADLGGAVAWSELYGYRDHEILTADYNAQEIQNGG